MTGEREDQSVGPRKAAALGISAGCSADLSTSADPSAARSTGFLVALSCLPGVGPATLLRCQDGDGPEAAWAAVVAGQPKRSGDLAEAVARLSASAVADLVRTARAIEPVDELRRHQVGGQRVLVRGTPGYPGRLVHDPAPPAMLFAHGNLEPLGGPTVAVVGTRNATRPGRDFAMELGAGLAEAGVAVVSGLALGIDGAAHRGALRAKAGGAVGAPVGVIASGLDVAYPRRHTELHRAVAGCGLLVSETPLGHRPTAWRFPARNRIIAGLADAVVVVESRSAGGSMLTVKEALDRGVTVLAVPGHPSAPAAAGTNDLLFDGAGIVRSVDDVLGVIGVQPPRRPEPVEPASDPALPPHHRAVLAALGDTPAALPEIVARSGMALDEVSEALVRLEGSQHLARSAGWYERTTPPGAGRRPGR